MARKMPPNDAYSEFVLNFENCINDNLIFLKNLVKIFILQTGAGKSFYQNMEMPFKLKEVFPQMKYIFRLSPTREVAYDGTFCKIHELPNNGKVKFVGFNESPNSVNFDAYDTLPDVVVCISITHAAFITHFDRLFKYAKNSVLVVEEAHQFIGAADPGRNSYVVNFGYSTEYTAETWKRIAKWRDVNPRVIGFTATPTEHHRGHSSLSDQFEICGKLADKKVILPSQSWMNKPHSYSFTKCQGISSVESPIHQSIDLLFEKEQKLIDLKLGTGKQLTSTRQRLGGDSNINTKLTSLHVCGDYRGVWGCPIDDVREIISKYLIADCGFSESEKMIATMVDSNSGGNTIWNLGGVATEKVDNQTLIDRLHYEHDPLRFLLVINRGRSGINVHNLSTEVLCRIRDPKEVKTPIPMQMFGRMVRTNPGTGDIIRKEYANNLDNYLKYYPKDYGVDIETVIETIKVTNTFDIWHPTNGKAKRTWEESLVQFEKDYVNIASDGFKYLHEFTGIKRKESFLPINLEVEVECPCDGSKFMVNVNKEVEEWKGDGTLDAFFNIV